jgi:hypothetical protein
MDLDRDETQGQGLRTTEVWEEQEGTWLRRVLGGEEGEEAVLNFFNSILLQRIFFR